MPPQPSIAAEVLSASIGGAFSASALYPLELLKTKVQAAAASSSSADDDDDDDETTTTNNNDDDGNDDNNNNNPSSKNNTTASSSDTMTIAKQIYEKGGISAFYAGVETSAFQSAMEKAFYFFAYTALKKVYALFANGERISTLPNLALGCAAEWAHLPLTLPIDCLTTKIQTDKSGKGALALLYTMLSEKGMRGMYKGWQAYYILCFKPAIQYTVYEQIKRLLLLHQHDKAHLRGGASSRRRSNEQSLSSAQAFLLGMISRTIATVLVFPYIRAKVMMQSGGGGGGKKLSIGAMLGDILKEDGMRGLFQGLGPELTRGVFSAALMMMVKEKIGFIVSKLVDER